MSMPDESNDLDPNAAHRVVRAELQGGGEDFKILVIDRSQPTTTMAMVLGRDFTVEEDVAQHRTWFERKEKRPMKEEELRDLENQPSEL